MPELDDSDPPNYKNYVDAKVTLDTLSTEELVQELIDRRALSVITARRKVPRSMYVKEKFYAAVQALLSCDLASVLVSQDMIGEDVIQLNNDLEFDSTIVVLRTNEEDLPI